MNFVNVEGVPTIPMLLEKSGYERFWIGVTAYFSLAFACTGSAEVLLKRLGSQSSCDAARGTPPCLPYKL